MSKKDLNTDEHYRRMVVSHKAFPAQYVNKYSISLGYDHVEGGTLGEFTIKWHELGGKLVPRLEVFDDGWAVLTRRFGDLLELLASLDDENPSPDDLGEAIRNLGDIVDETDKYRAETPAICQECRRPWPEEEPSTR